MRQGDPLSPLLFSLAVLSRGISKLVNDKKILHMASPLGYITSSHILYADDIFVFCRANKKSLRNLNTLLETYGNFSGQYVNCSKSSFFTMDSFARLVAKIQCLFSCSHGCLTFNYLGMLILPATRTWRNRFVALSALSTRLRLLQNHPQSLLLLLQTWPAKHTDGASSGRLHSDDQVSPQNHQRLEN